LDPEKLSPAMQNNDNLLILKDFVKNASANMIKRIFPMPGLTEPILHLGTTGDWKQIKVPKEGD
jgi:hypothetical protein